MKTQAPPVGFALFSHIVVSGTVSLIAAWSDKPELYLIAVIVTLWYLASLLFMGVRLLAEIRDQTKRTGQR